MGIEPGLWRTQVGLLLRMVGPLLQLVCLTCLLRTDLGSRSVLGMPGRSLVYGGFLTGFVLVLLGMLLSYRPRRG